MEKIMKKKVYFIIYSLALVLATTCFFQFVYPPPENATAGDQFACIRQDLDAKMYDGNIGTDKKFSIYYAIPSCYASNGYSLKKTFIYDGVYVAVTYENPDFKQGVMGGSGSTGGGLAPIQ